MTRTPVAIGSSVPAWPTFFVPASRRTRATTSCEVMPPGLSTMTRPLALAALIRRIRPVVFVGRLAVRVGVTGVRRPLTGAGELGVGVPGLSDEFLDPLRVLR